jgi:hypothetical protein
MSVEIKINTIIFIMIFLHFWSRPSWRDICCFYESCSNATRLHVWLETSCNGSSCGLGNCLDRKSVSWCTDEMSTWVPMGINFNSLYCFTQKNSQTSFAWTTFVHYSELSWMLTSAAALASHSEHAPLNPECNQYDPWQWNRNTSKYQTVDASD